MSLFFFLVLSAGDAGDGHRRRDRHRLDHQKQDHSHTVSGHSWIFTGSATNNTGESQTHADQTPQLVFSHGDAVSNSFSSFLHAGRNLLVAADGQLRC